LAQLLGRRRAVADLVQRRVADDPVQPRLQLDLDGGAAQRQQRLREGVLGDVLGAAADDRGGEAIEWLAVATDDLLEGRLIALAHELDQAPIGLGAQGRPEEDPGGERLGWGWGHGVDRSLLRGY